MNVREAKMFITRFVIGEHSPEEYAAFLQWLQEASIEELDVIADEHEALLEHLFLTNAGPSSEWIEQLERKLDRADAKKEQAPIKRLYAGRTIKWVAAASVVVLAAGGYWWKSQQAGSVPGSSGNVAEVLSKSFLIPRGGDQQQFELADGTKVWLNAASTLTYPVSFTGKARNVELSGEAYFEIAKNVDMPFRVKIRDANIEVLGTRFNAMAYEDEPVSKTTLVEGSVKVVRGEQELLLQQGDQAEITYSTSGVTMPIRLIRGVHQESILAWKGGDLEFKDDDLHTVMREIARCYNMEVKYEGNIPEKRFTGNFSRKSELQQILKQLETRNIHFRIVGKTITVTS